MSSVKPIIEIPDPSTKGAFSRVIKAFDIERWEFGDTDSIPLRRALEEAAALGIMESAGKAVLVLRRRDVEAQFGEEIDAKLTMRLSDVLRECLDPHEDAEDLLALKAEFLKCLRMIEKKLSITTATSQ